jgi:uncharacterized lipoprotein YmbA
MNRALLATCLLAGCLGLGPRPDETRFFTLTPLGPDQADSASDSESRLTLGLGPIVLPAYLDRTPVVRRTGPNEIGVSATDRWAEPLSYAFAATLRQNLVVLLGTSQVVLHPWSRAASPDLAIDVDVLHFEAATNGEADLTAQWHVRRVVDGTVLVGRMSRIVERTGGVDSDAEVAALSRALGTLSREIAAAVRAEHEAGHDRPPPSRPRAATTAEVRRG